MKVVVEDANVLLDLVNGDLLGHWLGLDFSNLTTHLVWHEVRDSAQRKQIQPFLDSGLLQLRDVAPDQWPELANVSQSFGVSLSDASVWMLARAEGAVLLSGDSKLRKSARISGVEVRGVLWVLDLLVERKRIKPSAAARALELILAAGAFLPREECLSRIALWATSKEA